MNFLVAVFQFLVAVLFLVAVSPSANFIDGKVELQSIEEGGQFAVAVMVHGKTGADQAIVTYQYWHEDSTLGMLLLTRTAVIPVVSDWWLRVEREFAVAVMVHGKTGADQVIVTYQYWHEDSTLGMLLLTRTAVIPVVSDWWLRVEREMEEEERKMREAEGR